MRYCSKCGMQLTDEQQTCPNCEPNFFVLQNEMLAQGYQTATIPKKKWDVLSIIGFCVSFIATLIDVLSVLYLILDPNLGTVLLMFVALIAGCCVGAIGLVLSIIGLVLSIKKKKRGMVFAIIGIILSALCVLIIVLGLMSSVIK